DDLQYAIQQNREKKRLVHDELVALHAKRQGIDALKTKDQLETEIEQHKNHLVQCVGPLIQQDQQFSKNFQAAQQLQQLLKQHSLAVELPDLDTKAFRAAVNAVIDGTDETGLDVHRLLTKDWIGIDELENNLQHVVDFE